MKYMFTTCGPDEEVSTPEMEEELSNGMDPEEAV